jgi:hypothetical protein
VTTLSADQIERPHVLVVEGPDDLGFFTSLARYVSILDVQVVWVQGKGAYPAKVKAVCNTTGFKRVAQSLGLVRDANNDPATAFESAQGALRALGLQVPSKPRVFVGTDLRVGIMIVPEETECGSLEHLCLRAVAGEPAMDCVRSYFECLEREGVPPPRIESKAQVLAYLASKHETDGRLGIAAERGYWPWDSRAFNDVREFLTQLVGA